MDTSKGDGSGAGAVAPAPFVGPELPDRAQVVEFEGRFFVRFPDAGVSHGPFRRREWAMEYARDFE